MSKDSEQLTDSQLANLVKLILGPPEEWDESDSELFLMANGIDPLDAPVRLAKLIEREIESLRQRGEEAPKAWIDLQRRLLKKAEANQPMREATARIQNVFVITEPTTSNRLVHVFGRRIKKLSENDKKILQELSSELLKEVEGLKLEKHQ